MEVEERDRLGRLVRDVWIAWAKEQPIAKLSWLVPYDEMTETDREVYRRIGEAVAREIAGKVANEVAELIALVGEIRAGHHNASVDVKWSLKDFGNAIRQFVNDCALRGPKKTMKKKPTAAAQVWHFIV